MGSRPTLITKQAARQPEQLRRRRPLISRRPQKQVEPEPTAPVEQPARELDPSIELVHSLAKADDEKRYTLGPLYTPGELDAHGEFVSDGDLQKAVWDYVRRGDHEIRDMHDTSKVIGELVEAVVWPFPLEVELKLADGTAKKVELPANTAYIGTVWHEDAWDRVKKGDIAGYSLGGKTVRVHDAREDSSLESMGKSEVEAPAEKQSGGDEVERRVLEFLKGMSVKAEVDFGSIAEKAAQQAVQMPNIELHTHAAPVEVDAGDVTVNPPEVHVTTPDAPDVHVDIAPAEVHAHLDQPDVTVNPPDVKVDVHTSQGATKTRITKRDPDTGDILETEQEPIEERR